MHRVGFKSVISDDKADVINEILKLAAMSGFALDKGTSGTFWQRLRLTGVMDGNVPSRVMMQYEPISPNIGKYLTRRLRIKKPQRLQLNATVMWILSLRLYS